VLTNLPVWQHSGIFLFADFLIQLAPEPINPAFVSASENFVQFLGFLFVHHENKLLEFLSAVAEVFSAAFLIHNCPPFKWLTTL
jgi:hypothetical protein